MLFKFALSVISCNDSLPSNARLPIISTFSPNSSFSIDAQPWNAPFPMLFTFALNIYNGSLESKRNVLDEESIVLKAEFENLKKTNDKIDIYSVAKSIDYFMASKVIFYQAIGTNIPSHVWLNSFYVDSSGAYGLEGETTSVDEVYLFFRNIKAQVPKSNLFLSKLSVDDADGVIDIEKAKNANYSFALSNNRYIEVQKRMQEAAALTDEITKLGSGAGGGVPDLPPELP